VWPAAHGINVVANGPAAIVRKVTDRYRAEWAALGKPASGLPLLGVNRLIVLAPTDAEVQRTAARAYAAWRGHMVLLWEAYGVPFPLQLPAEFAALHANGGAFAGTAAGARAYISKQMEAAGINYFVCDIAFGSMMFEEAMRTTELLAREVLPALAHPAAATV
jgi:hypothetical protein